MGDGQVVGPDEAGDVHAVGGHDAGGTGVPEKAAEPEGLTVVEVAAMVGMSVRNVRAYQARGLLAPPTRRNRYARYTQAHVERIRVIQVLQRRGFNLAAITVTLDDGEGAGPVPPAVAALLGDAPGPAGGPVAAATPGSGTAAHRRSHGTTHAPGRGAAEAAGSAPAADAVAVLGGVEVVEVVGTGPVAVAPAHGPRVAVTSPELAVLGDLLVRSPPSVGVLARLGVVRGDADGGWEVVEPSGLRAVALLLERGADERTATAVVCRLVEGLSPLVRDIVGWIGTHVPAVDTRDGVDDVVAATMALAVQQHACTEEVLAGIDPLPWVRTPEPPGALPTAATTTATPPRSPRVGLGSPGHGDDRPLV